MKWYKVPKAQDPSKQFVGRSLTAYPTAEDARKRTRGECLQVEHIAGNIVHQAMFQVNGSHLVSMLDAYCELNREPLPNQEMHEGFLSTVAEQVTRAPSAIDAHPKPVLHG